MGDLPAIGPQEIERAVPQLISNMRDLIGAQAEVIERSWFLHDHVILIILIIVPNGRNIVKNNNCGIGTQKIPCNRGDQNNIFQATDTPIVKHPGTSIPCFKARVDSGLFQDEGGHIIVSRIKKLGGPLDVIVTISVHKYRTS